MSVHSKKSDQTAPDGPFLASGIARRRLIRAGLAVPPVMMGLTSQSALACTTSGHISCSAWASLTAGKGCHASHFTGQWQGKTCSNYDKWPTVSHTECNKHFHDTTGITNRSDPNYGKPCVPFQFTDFGLTPTLKDVCRGSMLNGTAVTTNDAKRDLLGKHCASMWLNHVVNGSCPFSDPNTIKSIWAQCKNGGSGTCIAFGNVAWNRDQWCAYFDYLCTGTINWTPSCS